MARRAFRCGFIALVAGCLLAAGAGTAAQASTVLFARGAGGTLGEQIDFGGEVTADTVLGGIYRDDEFISLAYPNALWPISGLTDETFGRSVEIGVTVVRDAVRSGSGPVTVVGVSQGAVVVQEAMTLLNDDPSVSSDTQFVLIANPNTGLFKGFGNWIPILDYTPQPPTETRFATLVVINEYDGWADPVAYPGNPLTVANALMGMLYQHVMAENTDISRVPAANITVHTNSLGGTTTTYLVPAAHLPLTMPLRQLGVPDPVVDGLDGVLRPVIDAGYQRNDSGGTVPSAAQARQPGRPRDGGRTISAFGADPHRSARLSDGVPVPTQRPTVTASARHAGSSSPSGAVGTSARH